jgi:ribosomal 50S subunit-recycling heat shock protein
MRVDKFLKVSRVIKRRTVAKEACDAGRVSVNGKVAKAGTEIVVGDEIAVRFGASALSVRVISITESIRKEDAADMYEVISREQIMQ